MVPTWHYVQTNPLINISPQLIFFSLKIQGIDTE